MAEKRVRSGKKVMQIVYPEMPERSKTIAEIDKERSRAIDRMMMECAMRVARAMKEHFPDLDDMTNAGCDEYVANLRAVVDGKDGAAPVVQAGPVDHLGDAVRKALPNVPSVGSSQDECDEFVAAMLMDDGESGGLEEVVRGVFPDFPDAGDASACREYLEALSTPMASDRRTEILGEMFSNIMDVVPEVCFEDEDKMAKVEEAWLDYVNSSLSEIKSVFRGAVQNED